MKRALNKWFWNCTVLLVYLSYLTYFIKNDSVNLDVIFSFENVLVASIFIVVQICFNYVLAKFDKPYLKFIFNYFNYGVFTILNLTYLSIFILEKLQPISESIRLRFIFIAMLLLLVIPAYLFVKRFSLSIKVFNTFLITFIITNLIFSDFTVKYTHAPVANDAPVRYKETPSANPTLKAPNIIFILMDEYSSPKQIELVDPGFSKEKSFESALQNKGFAVIRKNETTNTSTINALNELFNFNAGISYEDKSLAAVGKQLKNAYVISKMNAKGYSFKNFGIFNIANHEAFYDLYPVENSNFEIFFRYSMLTLIIPNLKFDNLFNFNNFTVYADYNKKVELASLDYLQKIKPNSSQFIFVHFLMPHNPFYYKDEFPSKRQTIENYISYWHFSGTKISNYLGEIPNLQSYKVIVSGDHGYRFSDKIDPNFTMSAFLNFKPAEIDSIKSVQSIGGLLLNQ